MTKYILTYLLMLSAPMIINGQFQAPDPELQAEIMAMDKKYFDAYNECDLKTQRAMYTEDMEFYHDQGGLQTDMDALIESIERNICGKVTRELVPGSLEVYPIPNHGAVALGYHKFLNAEEPDAESLPSRFITIWKKEEGQWKMSRIVSLHR